jgi:hypothetical protein
MTSTASSLIPAPFVVNPKLVPPKVNEIPDFTACVVAVAAAGNVLLSKMNELTTSSNVISSGLTELQTSMIGFFKLNPSTGVNMSSLGFPNITWAGWQTVSIPTTVDFSNTIPNPCDVPLDVPSILSAMLNAVKVAVNKFIKDVSNWIGQQATRFTTGIINFVKEVQRWWTNVKKTMNAMIIGIRNAITDEDKNLGKDSARQKIKAAIKPHIDKIMVSVKKVDVAVKSLIKLFTDVGGIIEQEIVKIQKAVEKSMKGMKCIQKTTSFEQQLAMSGY